MIDLRFGDCLDVLPTIPDASVDAIISDPPYPEIDRSYGRLTEDEWASLMHEVVRQSRRILKPRGSAVFVLQPNSRTVGSMRPWLFDFQGWCCREWNIVQDVWWWNHTAPPLTKSDPDMLRSSLKACVWLGNPDCYRDGSAVVWEESDANKAARLSGRLTVDRQVRPGGTGFREDRARTACVARGGVTAFNVLPINGGGPQGNGGHPARTPGPLANWWVRYLTRPRETVLDMFAGSGTVPLEAYSLDRDAIGIENTPAYFDTMTRRFAEASAATPLFPETFRLTANGKA